MSRVAVVPLALYASFGLLAGGVRIWIQPRGSGDTRGRELACSTERRASLASLRETTRASSPSPPRPRASWDSAPY